MALFFYNNSRLLLLSLLLILMGGSAAYFSLPRLEDPEIPNMVARISTRFPGSDPERVEGLITEKVEEKISEIKKFKKIISFSHAGLSQVLIYLKNNVKEPDKVWTEIRDKLKELTPELPLGSLPPEFKEFEAKASTMIVALVWEQGNINFSALRRLAKDLEYKLQLVSGTEKIELFGDPTEEILVEVDPLKLVALKLTTAELALQILQSDAKVSAGQLEGTANSFLIEVASALDSIERVKRIPIQLKGSNKVIYLGNIASIKKGITEPASDLAFVDGEQGIVLSLTTESQQRIDLWTKQVEKALSTFEQNLPQDIKLKIIFKQDDYTSARFQELRENLKIATIVVMSVIFFMMGFKSSLIIGFSLPLCLMLVLIGMQIFEVPIHQISIIGIIIALGLLIDNAIVIVHEISHYLQKGMSPEKSITLAINHLKIPLITSTITTVLTFMPIALMQGDSGAFVKTLGFTVILSLVSSLLLSLILIPAIMGKCIKPGKSRIPLWSQGLTSRFFTKIYHWSLMKFFRFPILGVLLGLTIPILGFLKGTTLDKEFFPYIDRNQMEITIELSSSTSMEETKRVALEVRKHLLQYPEIDHLHWFVGKSSPQFYYNVIGGRSNAPYYAHGMVTLKSTQGAEFFSDLQKELEHTFPQASMLIRQLKQGPPSASPIEILIYGPNLEVLREWGDRARLEFTKFPGVTNTHSTLGRVISKLELHINEEKARLAGLDYTMISNQLNTLLQGSSGGTVMEDTEELPIRVRIPKSYQEDLSLFNSVEVLGLKNNGKMGNVPLSSLGEIKVVSELGTITRQKRERMNRINVYVKAGVRPSKIVKEFLVRWEEITKTLPQNYRYEFSGEREKRGEAILELMSKAGVLITLMAGTLVLSFRSFRVAVIIGLVAFLSIGLALGTLWITQLPFSFMAVLGTMGLIGVAINDTIVVLAAIHRNPPEKRSDRSAVVDAVLLSTRHVLATTITTIGGFIPLILGGGEMWPPMAIVIAGGVGGATLLALYFVPSLYLLLKRGSKKTKAKSINIES